MGIVLFVVAMILVFVAAFIAVIILVIRATRDIEHREMERDLDELSEELDEQRRARVLDHRYIHRLEVALVDAGLPLPS